MSVSRFYFNVSRGGLFVGFFQIVARHEDDGCECHEAQDDNLDVVAVAGQAVVELLLWHDGVHVPAQGGEHRVPESSADGGVEQEFPVAHARHAGRNGDEMADDGHEASGQCGHDAVAVEVALALLHFLLVEQAEVAPAAVGKAVDDGAAQIAACKVVDGGSAVGTERGGQDDEPHVEMATGSEVGGWRHDELRGHGDDGALEKHEEPNPIVVEVFEDELIEFHFLF